MTGSSATAASREEGLRVLAADSFRQITLGQLG